MAKPLQGLCRTCGGPCWVGSSGWHSASRAVRSCAGDWTRRVVFATFGNVFMKGLQALSTLWCPMGRWSSDRSKSSHSGRSRCPCS